MGFRDLFRRKALSASPNVIEALRDRRVTPYPALGGTNVKIDAAWQRGMNGTYGWIYASQPAVRSVIDYVASNLAQLSLKCFERVSDDERRRAEDHPGAKVMADPNGRTASDAFIYRMVTDYLIWDNAYCLKIRPASTGQLMLLRLPPANVTVSGGRFTPEAYEVWRMDGTSFLVQPDAVLHWYGYHPDDPLLGLSKLDTLRQELASDRAVQATLVELAKSGLKGGYIKRPIDAPEAKQEDLERIAELWKAGKLKGDPILDEGMEFVQLGITPKDAEVSSARQFTRDEVSREYGMDHCPPEDADERTQFIADVLTPLAEKFSNQLDFSILREEFGATDHYFEFDLDSKLQGLPEQRFPALTAAVGGPWMTRDEVRALENLPPLPKDSGGDKIIVPMNVQLAGEQGSPTAPQLPAPNVMPPQQPGKPAQDGSFREQPKYIEAEVTEVKKYNPRQPRDPGGEGGGRWIRGGGGSMTDDERQQVSEELFGGKPLPRNEIEPGVLDIEEDYIERIEDRKLESRINVVANGIPPGKVYQQTSDFDEIYAQAEREKKAFDGLLDRSVRRIGGDTLSQDDDPDFGKKVGNVNAKDGPKAIIPKLKERQAAQDKLKRKKGKYGPEGLTDITRASILVHGLEDLPSALKAFRDQAEADGYEVHDADNGFTRPRGQYKDMAMLTVSPDGHVSEVQFHIDSMWEAKFRKGGHDLYAKRRKFGELDRELTPSEQKAAADLDRQSTTLYARAWDDEEDRRRIVRSRVSPKALVEKPLVVGHAKEVSGVLEHHFDRQRRVATQAPEARFDTERWNRELGADLRRVFGKHADIDTAVKQINLLTQRAVEAGSSPEEAFEQMKRDAAKWADDIDRARVMTIAVGLLDAAEGE